MKIVWVKSWRGEKGRWAIGITLYDWALPLHIATYSLGDVLVSVLCFFIGYVPDVYIPLTQRERKGVKSC